MNRDDFEKTVSDWLDNPGSETLRRQIAAALEQDPGLQQVLDEWQRFDRLVRSSPPTPIGVDWEKMARRMRTAAACDDESADGRLDEALRTTAVLDRRVDWERLRERTVAAAWSTNVAASGVTRRAILRVVAGGLATAAAIGLAWLPTRSNVFETQADESEPAVVAVTVDVPMEPTNVMSGFVEVEIVDVQISAPKPERFFVLDPVVSRGPQAEVTDYY